MGVVAAMAPLNCARANVWHCLKSLHWVTNAEAFHQRFFCRSIQFVYAANRVQSCEQEPVQSCFRTALFDQQSNNEHRVYEDYGPNSYCAGRLFDATFREYPVVLAQLRRVLEAHGLLHAGRSHVLLRLCDQLLIIPWSWSNGLMV